MAESDFDCVFVHVRKAGGSSVKSMLNAAGVRFEVRAPRNVDPDGPLSFTVVRNPWDRFISGWKYLHTTKNRSIKDVLRNMPQKNVLDGVSLNPLHLKTSVTYLKHYLNERRFGTGHYGVGHDYRHITRTQTAFLLDSEGKPLVNEFVYFEDFEQGMRRVFDRLGVDFPGVKHANAGKNRKSGYQQYFDHEAQELFHARFRSDIEYWGYDFETGLPAALN